MGHNRRLNAFLAAVAACWAFAACPLPGQSGGIPSGSGHVPRIATTHRAVSLVNTLVIDEVFPGAPVALIHSPVAAPLPLATIGLGPAVLVPDPGAPGGGVILGLGADAAGEVRIGFAAHPALAGMPLWLQAVSIDPLAPWAGIALSDGTAFVFGTSRDTHAALSDNGAGSASLSRIFSDGSAAAPADPALTALTPIALSLTQSPEMAAARTDRPVADDLHDVAPILRLADGSVLAAYRGAGNLDVLCRIGIDGEIEELVRATGQPTEFAFAPEIAVSPHDPFAAVVAENPLPEYGGSTLLLSRIDGRSHAWSHAKTIGIALPTGIEPDSSTLTFLAGALFVGDGASVLFRHDLVTGVTTPVAFPASGGALPVYVDETCAVAEDGSAFAIGAGASDNSHDVFVVDATGTATNVTGLPGDYEDTAPGEADGAQMAISPDGSRVAYMRTVLENEAFVRDAQGAAPEFQLTPLSWFIDSIDTVTGFGFATSAEIFMTAGKNFDESDLYGHDAASGVVNLTATSGDVTAPYGLGSTLEPERRFTHEGSRFLIAASSPTTGLLHVHDALGQATQFTLGTLEFVRGLGTAVLIVDSSAGTVTARTVATRGAPALVKTWTSSSPVSVVAVADDPVRGAAAVLLDDGTVLRATSRGRLLVTSQPWTVLDGSLTFTSSGSLLATIATANGVEIHRERGPGGAWQLIGAAPTLTKFVR